MKKIKLIVELEYDDVLYHSGDADKCAKDWFYDELLEGDNGDLVLHSNHTGDEIGRIKVLWAEY